MKQNFFKLMLTALVLCSPAVVFADAIPNSLFADHAVLQRNVVVPVWGTARDGEKVTVEFAGQKVQTLAANGVWTVKLKPLKAGGPFTMTIRGDQVLTLTDILVGEVWVCSGQSNMAFKLPAALNGKQEVADANYPQIRQFYVPGKVANESGTAIKSKWEVCSAETAGAFTAVGYFFARDLYKKLHIPFGIISSSVGGTPAENWIDRTAMAALGKEFKDMVSQYDNSIETYPSRLAKYLEQEPALLAQYNKELAGINAAAARKPAPPQDPGKSGFAGGLYRGMIEPLQPYAIKGVIWYQGEANSSRGKQYQTLFPAMIADWRKAWGQGDFPFLFVQIAPFKGMSPEIREAQLLSWQKTPLTAMVVTTDFGNAEDIHPIQKQPIGARLALTARALAYKEKLEYSGPVYQNMSIQGDKARITFTHGRKLVAKDGPLKGFTIAGADKKFVEARADIVNGQVVVYSPSVATPVAVRYGWANVPDVNLYNEFDLPASPFRTDN